ncbi:hypothetical protein [Actinoplanes sp. CA-252034]|uniref:hypothetical protein n=1 Tax=Actinoplanes sp. CA-252034 TaxID=3239906 RepID=UPI003D998F86
MKKVGLLAAGAVVAGGLALGGATMAAAAPATPTPSTSAGGPGGEAGGPGGKAGGPRGEAGGPGGRPGGHGPGRGTVVTGDEAAKVTAAVTAEDAAVTVSRVVKGAAGAYHVFGTKDGERAHFTVSADLTTVTEGKAGPGRGHGRPGGGTVVTGAEAAKVTAAVTAEDAAVTVSRVVKGADGAYHVFGTKSGERVHFEVSADLKTVTEGKAGHRPERGDRRPAPSPSKTS